MQTTTDKNIALDTVSIDGETYLKISNSDAMRPFFMSIVSPSDHWMFIASNGGVTAGRQNANSALFPYYTDDKITESADLTGSKTLIRVLDGDSSQYWEPFSQRFYGYYKTTRNLYKNTFGNKVRFEEINHDLQLAFVYEWNTSDKYGFIKRSTLQNLSNEQRRVTLIDGIQNIIPSGIGSDTQNSTSNLVDAYKRNELEPTSGLGIFALSAVIVDKAEPSEALRTTVAYAVGMPDAARLLSSLQLDAFREGNSVHGETDVKAEKGAYFITADVTLETGASKEWLIVAEVNQNHRQVINILDGLQNESALAAAIDEDIAAETERLKSLCYAADSLQLTADKFRDKRHFANVLFNIMRGGIFDHNYDIEKVDFLNYIEQANRPLFDSMHDVLQGLSEIFTVFELNALVAQTTDANFQRLCTEYLPLKFSRRHGDPSRPWNKFSINTRNPLDGSKILDYEGNWRDIFQNWEALALSYPEFLEGMITKFLNASTFDGYNPYRVTKDGFDWETIEPDDPWSYIGYWGDHQIIYLLKFLELIEQHKPGRLADLFDKDAYVYANVPYTIKPYADIVNNPKDTIDFDHENDEQIRTMREAIGADGALLRDESGEIYQVNFIEKILATVLSKLSNLIPEGGIWMNTQRPEWNDANNALVGNGVSMVTLCYLRRFLLFFDGLTQDVQAEGFKVSNELVDCYKRIRETLEAHYSALEGAIGDDQRRSIVDGLGQAASDFRWHIYKQGFWGKKRTVSTQGLRRFIRIALDYLEHAIDANRRPDGMYHAYNLMTVEPDGGMSISRLSEMLEGQVAVLSAGYLSAQEALDVLDGLKASALFREDQYSYLLYPNKELPGFLQRNNISAASVERSKLLQTMIANDDRRIMEKDSRGGFHFNGNFKNANDVKVALETIDDETYQSLIDQDEKVILDIFEEAFNHKAFTGRSGTFYGYEGLGSIYWHMVSKLQLAVMECCVAAIHEQASDEIVGRLLEHYYEINEGIGVHKSPSLYGAFPTDPYSHTPAGKGAQQPGMTGQVKEDILSRMGELGVFVSGGTLSIDPCLLRKDEFLQESRPFTYTTLSGEERTIEIQANALCFLYCQVPIIYSIGDEKSITIETSDARERIEGWQLGETWSAALFNRSGTINSITVSIPIDYLK